MLTQLALQNIRRKKFRTFLASLSIAIGTASLILFLGLSNGIREATFEEIEKKSPLTQITVHPKVEDAGIVSFLAKSDENKLNQQTIKEISEIEGVKAIYPEIQFNNFSSLEASLLGFSLITDTMVFGMPTGFIEDDLSASSDNENPAEIWKRKEQPYPALIPRRILDLYNLGIAIPRGLPTVSEESLLGKDLKLYPNYSTFFPGLDDKKEVIRLEVVGFSDKINILGATLPYEIVSEMNAEYSNGENLILELFVETEDASKTAAVATQIEELGYNTQYFQKNLQEVEARFTYLSISLGSISFIILITAGIAIISTFLATIAERRREIGLFRALGATKSHIKKLILIEAGIIGLIGSLIGLLIGLISSGFLEKFALKQLESTTFTPKSLIAIDLQLVGLTILFGLLLSILAAYIPAQQAAKITPNEALK